MPFTMSHLMKVLMRSFQIVPKGGSVANDAEAVLDENDAEEVSDDSAVEELT